MRKNPFSSQRAQLALRFFTYGVMAITTIILSVIAIFYALGYRFNQNLVVEQGGLVQVRSTPEGAAVFVDGQRNSATTPGRVHMSPGTHTIEMVLDGYHTWRRTFELMPGQLLWLDYTKFIPTNLQTTAVRSLGQVRSMTPSPDRRWLLMHSASADTSFLLADVNDAKAPIFTTLATNLPVDPASTYTVTKWDVGSRYFLVKRTFGDKQEFFRVDRTEPTKVVSITGLFRLEMSDVQFSADNPNILYAKTGDVLRRLDINGSNVSAALVTGLQDFTVSGDNTIAFSAVQAEPNEQVIGLYRDNKAVIVRSFPLNSPVYFAFAEYFRHDYLAIGQPSGQVDVLRDPFTTGRDTAATASFKLDGQALAQLSFGHGGRMIIASGVNNWVVHDLEVNKTYVSSIDGAVSLRWLDSYSLYTQVENRLHIVEFDGQNGHDITTVLVGGHTVSLSRDGKFLFSLGGDSGAPVLQATALVN